MFRVTNPQVQQTLIEYYAIIPIGDTMDNINKNLIHFWNDKMKLDERDKREYLNYKDKSLMDIVPSKRLYDKVVELKDCKNVLDYGAGIGWASISLGLLNCHVDAVDMGDNIINTIEFYREAFHEHDNVKAFKIDSSWIKNVSSNTYDGIVCSNVLDVIPLETAKEILFHFHRILKENSKVIIGLNYYISLEQAKESKMELVDGHSLFIDGILRLSSYSDLEWMDLFSMYFTVEELSYFKWDGETKEARRLFVLKRK